LAKRKARRAEPPTGKSLVQRTDPAEQTSDSADAARATPESELELQASAVSAPPSDEPPGGRTHPAAELESSAGFDADLDGDADFGSAADLDSDADFGAAAELGSGTDFDSDADFGSAADLDSDSDLGSDTALEADADPDPDASGRAPLASSTSRSVVPRSSSLPQVAIKLRALVRYSPMLRMCSDRPASPSARIACGVFATANRRLVATFTLLSVA